MAIEFGDRYAEWEPPEELVSDRKSESSQDVTALLADWANGAAGADERLILAVQRELRRLAASYLRRERSDHTLQPTALVNEAYVRLVGQRRIAWRNRSHFFGIAAQIMRRILVDHARRKQAVKRAGAVEKRNGLA